MSDVEARRAARKQALAAEADAQRAKDLEVLDSLEQEHGDSAVSSIEIAYRSGLPTMVVVKTPVPVAYKRFRDTVRRKTDTDDQGAAADMLADVCVVYPDCKSDDGKALYARMREACPALHDQVFVTANKLAEGKTVAEKKG